MIIPLVNKELRSYLRWRTFAWLWLLVIPLGYTLIFSAVYMKNIVQEIPTVICDEEQSASARILVDAYRNTERFKVVAQVNTIETMNELLRREEALVGVVIPADFSERIKKGHTGEVLLAIEAKNLIVANSAISSAKEIARTINVGTGQKLLGGLNRLPSEARAYAMPIGITVRITGNPINAYSPFILAGLIANGVQIALLLFAGTLLCREYRRLRKWQGYSSGKIIVVKFVPCWIYSTVSFFICLSVATKLFGLPFVGNLGALMLLITAFTFCVTGLCIFISALFPAPTIALQMPLLYMMPGLLYSGLSWPHSGMNELALKISYIMPLTYLGEPLRNLSIVGTDSFLASYVLKLVIAGMAFIFLSILAFSFHRKRIMQKVEVAL